MNTDQESPSSKQPQQSDLWFFTPDTETLCRGGGNGPNHPSQLYAIKKYVEPRMSFLDYGCGSGTTLEALLEGGYHPYDPTKHLNFFDSSKGQAPLFYHGTDIIGKNIEWCQQKWPDQSFFINPSIHKIDQDDRSFDVVYSRHVVDHMRSFEDALDEHCRVSRSLVIVVLWTGLLDSEEHEIKNIVDQRGLPTEKVYPDEYTNNYSRKKVLDYLENKEGWKLMELTENVGAEVKGCDTVIVLKKI